MKRWDKEQLFFSGDEYFREMFKEIAKAQVSVDFETYIVDPGGLTDEFEELLIATARRGVKVRVVVDGIGARPWIGRWRPELIELCEIRIFHPIYWWNTLRSVTRFLQLANRRIHRKTCLIDGKVGWIGSLNLSGVHLERFAGPEAWRDTGIRVEGEDLIHLTAAFESVWSRSHTPHGKRNWLKGFKVRRVPQGSLVRLNFSRRLRWRTRVEFKNHLRHARQRIWITNPYFAPTVSLLRLLIHAKRRGVDVAILIPRKSDVFFMRWVAASYYGPILKGGVRVFEYLPTMLHAKSVLVDDWATVGTTNMNQRSFLHDLEVDVIVTREENKKRLEAQFFTDLEKSEEITLDDWYHRAFTERVGRVVANLFRHWI